MTDELHDHEELLFDVQTPPILSPAEQRIVTMLTRGIVAGAVVWATITEIVSEVSAYRTKRKQM